MNRLSLQPALAAAFASALIYAGLATPAFAARGHVFDHAFGETGAGNGQLSEPSGLAINEESGDVYVVDKGNNRVERFSATGTFLGQFDGSGSFETEGVVESGVAAGGGGLPGELETGKFAQPEGIAIDNSCSLHLPKPLTNKTSPTCASTDESNGDIYVADIGHQVIDKFDSTGKYVGQISGTPNGGFELHGVAVDASGQLWVSEEHIGLEGFREKVVDSFSNATENQFGSARGITSGEFETSGLGVTAEDDYYVAQTTFATNSVVKYGPSGEVLGETLDTEPTKAIAVELTTDDVYIDNFGAIRRFGDDGGLLETLSVGGLSSEGVAVGARSETVYATDAAANVVDVFAPAPPSAPTIESEAASDVSGDSATLEAEINPQGAPTTYDFEYGLCAGGISTCASSSFEASVPIPDGAVGADFQTRTERVHLQNLTQGATYHFRVVARSGLGTVRGSGQSFRTQSGATGFGLPDGREWELVSPPDKHGALIEAIGEKGLVQAAANGNGITYLTNAPTELDPQGDSNESQIISMRDGAGWRSQDIAIPHEETTGKAVGPGEEYQAFSMDLSAALVQPLGAFDQNLSAEASEQTPFLRTSFSSPGSADFCVHACFHPLVTGAAGVANIPAGTEFGQEGKCAASGGNVFLACGPQFQSASPDLRHVVFNSITELSSGAGERASYEWNDGKLTAVSLLPNGEASPNPLVAPGQGDRAGRHAVSEDGTHVVWGSESALYLRDTAKQETVQLDAADATCEAKEECVSGGGVFQFASANGAIVYFTDTQRLTSDAGATTQHADLYECRIVEGLGGDACQLSDVTPRNGAEQADVQGQVVGASDDGSVVVFVANGVLASGGSTGNCERRKEAALCNLYVHDPEGTRWLATLSSEDRPDWAEALIGTGSLGGLTARVSPDGSWVAFMSDRSLTGYDNRDAVSGRKDEELYLSSLGKGGTPVCVSCNPTGARPHGTEYAKIRTSTGGLAGGPETWLANQWIAASVPGWTQFRSGFALYQSRYLDNSGRLFFNSSDGLDSHDVNGNEDVYQFEPAEVGSCTATAPSAVEQSGGCLGLISSGTSSTESAFLDASEDGNDVFFLTAAKLVSQDSDDSVDVYDAHQCEVSAPCFSKPTPPPAPCDEGESCRGAPSTQPNILGLPPSAALTGLGNVIETRTSPPPHNVSPTRAQKLARALKACLKKRKGRERRACNASARRRFGPHRKTRKATRTSIRRNVTSQGRR